jgi:hypothetical protein
MSRRPMFSFAALVISLVLLLPTPAGAITAVERADRARRDAANTATDLRALLQNHTSKRVAIVTLADLAFARGGHVMGDEVLTRILEAADRHDRRRTHAVDRIRRRIDHRIDTLRRRRERLAGWLDRLVFRVCPVEGYTQIYDDFGEMVRLPGVPVHRHEGVDITAPTGTPIRAPFDGYASSSWGELGGLGVRVENARGHVYNGHLSAVGNLGWVRAGTIIGYVGATGDATAPHDHIEWHPGGGPAVDPYPMLATACLPV